VLIVSVQSARHAQLDRIFENQWVLVLELLFTVFNSFFLAPVVRSMRRGTRFALVAGASLSATMFVAHPGWCVLPGCHALALCRDKPESVQGWIDKV